MYMKVNPSLCNGDANQWEEQCLHGDFSFEVHLVATKLVPVVSTAHLVVRWLIGFTRQAHTLGTTRTYPKSEGSSMTCYRWDVVGSLPRSMPMVVDYWWRCVRRRSRWWCKRNTGSIQVRTANCVIPYVLRLCRLYWYMMRCFEGGPCPPYIVRGARLQI
jgi:hypothetical protein